MTTHIKLLVIEDDVEDYNFLSELLSLINTQSFNTSHVTLVKECKNLKDKDTYDLVLSDLNLPDSQGHDTIKKVLEYFPDKPIIVLTGNEDEQFASEVVNLGIQDYLVKGMFDEIHLLKAINFAINRKEYQREIREQKNLLSAVFNNTSQILFLADENVVIEEINKAGKNATIQDLNGNVGKRGGEAFACVNHFKSMDGCGHSAECKKCDLRNAIQNTFLTKSNYTDVKTRLEFVRDEVNLIRDIIFSTAYLDGEHPKALVSMNDVTALEDNRRAIEILAKTEKAISTISSQILIDNSVDYNVIVEQLGQATSASRAVIFHFSDKDKRMNNTYEWCADGIQSQLADLQNIDCELFPWWMYELRKGKVINISNVNDLPPSAEAESRMIEKQNMKSILVFPIYNHLKELSGFLGLAETKYNREWEQSIVEAGKIIVQIKSNSLTRLHALETIKKEKKRSENILQATNAGTWELNLETEELIINERWAQLIGHEMAALVPTNIETWAETVHPDDIENAQDKLKNLLEGKVDFYDVEYRQHHKNGSWIWINSRGNIVEKNIDGTPLRIAGTHLDISKRKTFEIELRRNEQLLNETGRLAKIGGWELDVETMKSYYSPETKRIYGIPLDEEPPKGIKGVTFYAEEAQPIVMEAVKKALENGESYQLDVPFITAQGKNKWVRTIGLAEKKNKKVKRLYGTIQDITEQKRWEKELIDARKKAEESDHLKSAFLANMSHEIRTPMNGILGFVELLSSAEFGVEEKESFVSIIKRSGNRLLDTINDIIEISKIESGQIDYHETEIDLVEVMNYYHDFFSKEAESKGIKLIYTENNISSLEIRTDKIKLDSILTNLVKNAIKFTTEGTIEFGFNLIGEHINFHVKDTGCGLSPEDQIKVFERFIQADNSNSRGHEGSGLGLAICKNYAQLLGGDIRVESELGKGSIFYVSIKFNPVEDSQSKVEIAMPEQEVLHSNSYKILIAEDDESSFQFLDFLLSRDKYEVIRATDGKKALEEFKNNTGFDVILMDMKMPIMDGYEATREIRKLNPTIPIIAQTAFALNGDRQEAMDAGCTDYISKPIVKEKLFALLGKYM